MHPNRKGIHLTALRCLRAVLGFALDTIGKAAYCPSGNPRTTTALPTESQSETGIIMQHPLRLPPQLDS
jgi:hypothetical protein